MKIGCYMPIYGGWIKGKEFEEPEVTFEYIKRSALIAERVGFDSIWVPDHMLNPIKGENAPCLEAWTVLAALATLTERVTLSHITICQGFRKPAILAKMSATLSEISNGRFVLSMGAGWWKREFDAYDIPWTEHDDRVAQTREQIEIIKSLWTKDVTSYKGRFHRIIEGVLEPKPTPPPEVWYGGVSEDSKKLVAELADGWLIYGTTPDDLKQMIESMQAMLVNREIHYAVSAMVFIGKTDKIAIEKLKLVSRGREKFYQSVLNKGLVGSPETIRNQIMQFEYAGANHLLLQFNQTLKDLELFSEVIVDR